MGAAESTLHPCDGLLQAYVTCMEVHQGKRPDPYEPEWCESDKDAYRECRDKLKAEAAGCASSGDGGDANVAGGGGGRLGAC